MRINLFLRAVALVVSFTFFVSASDCFCAPEAGVKIPFGAGSDPKPKQVEEKKGSGSGAAMVGLIVLGACIVAAAIILTNKVDDVRDDVKDGTSDLDSKVDEIRDDYDDRF